MQSHQLNGLTTREDNFEIGKSPSRAKDHVIRETVALAPILEINPRMTISSVIMIALAVDGILA